jgi:hypothetical protein
MKNLLNPRLLFLVTTAPVLILFSLLYNKYTLIHTLLDESAKLIWLTLGTALLFLIGVTTAYGFILVKTKKETSIYYALLSLISYITILYVYTNYYYIMLPFSIPQWMVSDEVFFYAGTFLMPTLIHSVFILVAWLTPEERQNKNWVNFVFALLVPAVWYIFFQVILPLWRHASLKYENHVITIFFIAGTVLFLFFITRGIYILSIKKGEAFSKYQLLWKIPISIVFPLLGLAINNGLDIKSFSFREYDAGVFGDFNGIWFYLFALVNGILVCLPNLENKLYRFILFLARAVTFSYTLYFFVVFLPYLPLSILAIIVAGLGFLMLTPLLLIIIHTNELYFDFQFLKKYFSSKLLIGACVIAILALPSLITLGFYRDRFTLAETLSYLYTPNYSKDYEISSDSLTRTLHTINSFKTQGRGETFSFVNKKTPYISSYFNWIVLDNMTLSDSKIQFIEKVFFGKSEISLNTNAGLPAASSDVKITDIKTKSNFDSNKNTWTSTIDLEIKNTTGLNLAEYSTKFTLPVGAWISDYYLFVGDRKELGILAEKKAAMWVYSQIRNERRDPGILYYTTGNEIAFKVFPFSHNEVRKTGFELIHKEPVEINLDGKKISLGNNDSKLDSKKSHGNKVIYVSSKEKAQLPKVQRTPYYHFLIDTSLGKEIQKEKYIQKIESLLKNSKQGLASPRFSIVNQYTKDISKTDWKTTLGKAKFVGGFYLDRAIRQTLVESYEENKKEFPILIVVTEEMQSALIEKDFSDLAITYPEGDLFYELGENGKSLAHSLTNNPHMPVKKQESISFDLKVYEMNLSKGHKAYLPLENKPSIVLPSSKFEIIPDDIKTKDWNSGLSLQGKWISHTLHPEISETEWLSLVKYSFISKFLTPVTSYMVVENEAQKEALRRKQEQVLSSNKSLDTGEDVQRMSEPNFYLLLGLFGVVVWIRSFIMRRTERNR